MALLSILLSFNLTIFAEDSVRPPANTYEVGSLPDFLPHVGKALPGRCRMASGSNKKIASVLMISFGEDGFEIAPFDAERSRLDTFDDLSYEQILKAYPMIKKMYLWVSETAVGAVLERTQGADEIRSEIRETEKYMVMRVLINGKIKKYCNYLK